MDKLCIRLGKWASIETLPDGLDPLAPQDANLINKYNNRLLELHGRNILINYIIFRLTMAVFAGIAIGVLIGAASYMLFEVWISVIVGLSAGIVMFILTLILLEKFGGNVWKFE